MSQTDLIFESITLENRMGRPIVLNLKCLVMAGRHYVFIKLPQSTPSNMMSKNAEHIAFQLVSRFGLLSDTLDVIEMREQSGGYDLSHRDLSHWDLLRWRFEWVGTSPLAGYSQLVGTGSQQEFLSSVLTLGEETSLRYLQECEHAVASVA